MSTDPAAPGPRLLALWTRFRRLPGGARLFGLALGRMVPYTGTIRPIVEELEPGRARVRMDDRRRVRNHLRSVHAVALTNLGELSTGLATLSGLPNGVRGIVVGLSTSFHAKARGAIVATCEVELPPVPEGELEVNSVARLTDPSDRLVATVTATWRLRRGAP